jgi:hypothetical protein
MGFTLDQDIWFLVMSGISIASGSHHSGVVGVYTLEEKCRSDARVFVHMKQPVPLRNLETRCRHYVIKIPEIETR